MGLKDAPGSQIESKYSCHAVRIRTFVVFRWLLLRQFKPWPTDKTTFVMIAILLLLLFKHGYSQTHMGLKVRIGVSKAFGSLAVSASLVAGKRFIRYMRSICDVLFRHHSRFDLYRVWLFRISMLVARDQQAKKGEKERRNNNILV